MKTIRWTMAAALIWAGAARAGSLDPTNAPGPTMHTLEEIYQQLLTAQQQVLANQQRLEDMQQRLVAAGSMQTTSGDMILIPAGSFVMGATTNAGHEVIAFAVPQHTVSVSAFYMDRHEVTRALWSEVFVWATNRHYVFDNPGLGKADDHPVHTVNWYDCLKWCNARSVRDGFTACYTNADGTIYTNGTFAGGCNWNANGYRLPSEAEWEKAARGGIASRRFPWSDANTIEHVRANYLADPATYSYDLGPTPGYHPGYTNAPSPYTSPVGSFAANGYGLYGVAGNVHEWCWDWYSNTYYAVSSGSDPIGPLGPLTYRVMRGGGFASYAAILRCAQRNYDFPTAEATSIGFRSVRKP